MFVSRKLACIEYGRPLVQNWTGSLGLSWQQVRMLMSSAQRRAVQCRAVHHWACRLGARAELSLPPAIDPRLPANQACCVDDHGRRLDADLYGAPLTFSGKEHDTMALGTLRVAYK